MKQVIIAVAMLTGLIAQADLGSRIYTSRLTTINLDKKLANQFGQIDVDGGSVTLDYGRKEATLTLYRRMHCPPGRFCALVMPAPIIFKLPITSQRTDGCKSKIVTATDVVPFLPVVPDQVTTLTITDNTKNICPTFVALEPTEVVLNYSYTVFEPMVYRVSTYSTMTGERLIRANDQL
jgi:hypothetical protein